MEARPFIILSGDATENLTTLPDRSVQLCVTSPPYADKRRGMYGGVAPDQYVEWFLGVSSELKRVLKVDGSFVLNIKEGAREGRRETYVYELVLALAKQGWRWVDEYIWHKTTCYPGKWPNRFRDAFERCYHFTISPKFKMNQEAVMRPVGDWASAPGRFDGKYDSQRKESESETGMGRRRASWKNRDKVYPSNVISCAPEFTVKNHPAPFPKQLPAFFVDLFSDHGDLVLDPFAGSGTTGVVAVERGRRFIGIDLKPEYNEFSESRILAALPSKETSQTYLTN
jgi:site-specific DNA-methyltransferase (adenine-specific)